MLCHAGVPSAIHGSIARMMPVYEEAGFTFPGWYPYSAKRPKARRWWLFRDFVFTLRRAGRTRGWPMCPDWAAIDNARNRVDAEELIPYSDHVASTNCSRWWRRAALGGGCGPRLHRGLRSYPAPRGVRSACAAGKPPRDRMTDAWKADGQLALTCEQVARWNSRLRKVRILAEYLGTSERADLARAVRFLCCGPIQSGDRKFSVGGSTLREALLQASGWDAETLAAVLYASRRHRRNGWPSAGSGIAAGEPHDTRGC